MKRRIQALAGVLIGLLLLWFLFRDTNWAEVGRAVRGVHPGWFFAAQIPLWVSFFVRVQRWTYIVRATDPHVTYKQLFNATQLGFLAIFTVGRIGEPIRPLVLTRIAKVPFSKTLSLSALDRVTDLFGVMAIMLIAVIAYQPDERVVIPAETFSTKNDITFTVTQYQAGAMIFVALIIGITAAFVLLYVNRKLVLRISDWVLGKVSESFAARVHIMINHFADGLHVFRSPVDMSKSIFFSLLTWFCGMLYFAGLLAAFRVEAWPWYTPFVMQTLLAAFIGLPGAPGLVGQYHVPLVIALVMVVAGIDVSHAKAYAIMAHIMNLPPIILTAAFAAAAEREHLFVAVEPPGKTSNDQSAARSDD